MLATGRKYYAMNRYHKKYFALRAIPPLLAAIIFGVATPAAAALDSAMCQSVVTQALQVIQDKCSNISRNSACYGNNQIQASFADSDAPPTFQTLGDVVALKQITGLVTSPYDETDSTWGLALLKVQANLPDTMPGQNVTFLVYGDTTVQNTSGDMRVFYFSSGLGSPACTEVPESGIVVQSPNHIQVNFNANGVNIQIASTILLQAVPDKTLEVTLIEGHATVSTSGGSQNLLPGQKVSVPIGGANGLTAQGAPARPITADQSVTSRLKGLVKVAQTINPPGTLPSIPTTAWLNGNADNSRDSANSNNNSHAVATPAPDKGNGGNGNGNGVGNQKH